MKNILLIIFSLALLTSCGEFQKVINGTDAKAKYDLAWKYYKKEKYKRADQLFTQVDKVYRNKPVYQRLLFAHAMSLYHMKYYTSAGAKLRKFTQLYPESSKAEDAAYYIVKSYDILSPKYSVDQAYTKRAIEEIQAFIKKYPYSKYSKEINQMDAKLTARLEKKDLEISKQYFDLTMYKAAITAFNNFLIDHPGSKFTEEALYYKFKAMAELALNSVTSKKENRLRQAENQLSNFKKKYPDSIYLKELNKINKKIQSEKKQFNS